MRIPSEIQGEWSSLGRHEDPAENLRSVDKIRAWLDEAAESLARMNPGSARDPKMFGHGKSNVRGVTSSEFDGVDTSTLRFWEGWWSDAVRTKHGREEAGREPEQQVAKIRREIDAREP